MSQRFVVRATGPARPGQTAALGTALVSANCRLLDLSQHVAFGEVTLEALVETADDLGAMLPMAGDVFGLDCRVEKVSAESEALWADVAKDSRWVLTLMAPTLSAEVMAEVGALTAEQGLIIERVKRLSAAAGLGADTSPDGAGACLEWRLSGAVADSVSLREKILALSERFGVDVALQPSNAWRRHRRLICFDMDSTLIQAEVIDELARRHGVYEEVASVTERAMRGELDFQQSFRERMSKLEGLDESVLAEIADSLPLMPGLERLMRYLKRLGYRTAILSGGFTYFARHLQQRLGFDEIHANELVIRDGKVTGEVAEPIVDAGRKAMMLRQIAEREGWDLAQTVAVGDGANDLEMLSVAGLGVAFHAKPLVRRQARQSVSTLGLDGLLYLLGYSAAELEALSASD
ncbi:MAG: phosphoserine phosphatase SerB [Salinicola sp.]|uniref:phosphoserine phosphatase SerB n=1 Tax=Salinicola sp. TaxID=1978524 RepID=UPI000C980CD7|nr:phosphoserine phosphatase SerB [Salinicola sp.]MAM58437.1 phosphoserine phosphatase SerB [Salinicola sp.]NRB54832.1 phosphoserine phosphatase SerB [Salinicola sp.]